MHHARTATLPALPILAAVLVAGPARAEIVIDQQNTFAPGGAVPIFNWQQSFRPSYNNITGAEMELNFGTPGTVTIRLLDAVDGTEIASGTATGAGRIAVDFGGPVPVTPEAEYFLKLESSYQFSVATFEDPYPRGVLYLDGAPFNGGNGDAWFRTYSDTTFAPGCSPADLTTTGTSNGTPDGAVDISDYSFYLTLWAAGDPDADVTTTGTSNGTPDGAVDVSDFSFYLTLWAAGCP